MSSRGETRTGLGSVSGASPAPLLASDPAPGPDFVYTRARGRATYQAVARSGRFKLVHVRATEDRTRAEGEYLLFDLEEDAAEERNLAAVRATPAAAESPAPDATRQALLEALAHAGD